MPEGLRPILAPLHADPEVADAVLEPESTA
jgi:hypothetical protein